MTTLNYFRVVEPRSKPLLLSLMNPINQLKRYSVRAQVYP